MSRKQSMGILIPTFKTTALIDPYEITHIQAKQNYCILHYQDGRQLLVSISFGKVLEIFALYDFCQCHKSYAVQLKKVLRYLNDGKVEVEGNFFVPVARRRKQAFLEVMNGGE